MDNYTQMYTRVKLLGRDANLDHTQTIGGGDTAKLLGGYIPHPPRISAPLTAVLLI